MRAFLALPLPDDVRHRLARMGGAIPKLRAQKPETLHLTIRFLGDVEAAEPILEGLAPVVAAFEPFRFSLRGLGAFPNERRARVVWAAVEEGAERAADLAQAVERALKPLGFPPEKRPWRGHVTLGRFRNPAPFRPSEADRTRAWGEAPAEALLLYRSELRPEGARHEVVGELSLLGGM